MAIVIYPWRNCIHSAWKDIGPPQTLQIHAVSKPYMANRVQQVLHVQIRPNDLQEPELCQGSLDLFLPVVSESMGVLVPEACAHFILNFLLRQASSKCPAGCSIMASQPKLVCPLSHIALPLCMSACLASTHLSGNYI